MKKKGNQWIIKIGSVAFFCLLLLTFPIRLSATMTLAKEGEIYTCTLHPEYAHPVTGEIEDAGGESGRTTGQGMIESALKSEGMMEKTSEGKYYLTFRMSLLDYTKDHSFEVQKWGEDSWTKADNTQTAKGTDSNGATADMRIQIPSQKCVIRGRMYVEAMGREVIFYFYPDNLKKGKPSDMEAKIVTKESAKSSGKEEKEPAATPHKESKQKSKQDSKEEGKQEKTEKTDKVDKTGETESDPAQEEIETSDGLSLSTESQESDTASDLTSEDEQQNSLSESSSEIRSVLQWIVILTVSITVSGLILMMVAAFLVKYFLDNRWKWFDDETDD